MKNPVAQVRTRRKSSYAKIKMAFFSDNLGLRSNVIKKPFSPKKVYLNTSISDDFEG